MKIDKIVLCYADMDRIIVEKPKNGSIEDALNKFDLSLVVGMDVTAELTPEEFQRFRAMNQRIDTGTNSNIVADVTVPRATPNPNQAGEERQ